MNRAALLSDQPYHLPSAVKQPLLLAELNELTARHRRECQPFRRIMQALPGQVVEARSLDELPLLPVQLFKLQRMASVPPEKVYRELNSSGTTGQQPSRIFLDEETSILQTRALVKIVTSFLGTQRLPMIIIDSREALRQRGQFNARAAGILGFANFGQGHFYLLDQDMQIDWDGLARFLQKYAGRKIFLFGFTFIIWKHFYQACVAAGKTLDLGDSILIHGGGWKKLQEEQVTNAQFNCLLRQQQGIARVHNYYGMVEQVGSIYMECEQGYFHAPNYSDVCVRDIRTMAVLPFGRKGLIQTVSILPRSYPGNSLLTEDIGMIVGEDDCPCGRQGKYFVVEGRLPAAELRGCSDTYEVKA